MDIIQINRNPSSRLLREFAISWIVVMGLLGALSLYHTGHYWPTTGCMWIATVVIGVSGLVVPRTIRPVYLGLCYGTLPIGWVFSHVLLGAIYYLVITPIGLVMKCFRRDAMARKMDPDLESYWTAREEKSETDRYLRQY